MEAVAHSYGPLDPELRRSDGARFRDVRRTLTPKYATVWVHIALGYVALAASVLLATLPTQLWSSVLMGLLGALSVGYWMAYVQLFFHEAGHFGLARDRRRNDLLANLFIGSWIGASIKAYRTRHFAHHRDLGQPDDPERTYFERLSLRFIVESLSGIRVIRVLLHRRNVAIQQGPRSGSATTEAKPRERWPLLVGLAAHGLILIVLTLHARWAALGAWCVGIGSVYPFLASLRQLLEHRPIADATNLPGRYAALRMFGAGPLASTFGGAGFNLHLLHHMEPQISYTRLADLQAFMESSELASWLAQHQSTYRETFLHLVRADRRANAGDPIRPAEWSRSRN
jgi:fatty acid desaturase